MKLPKQWNRWVRKAGLKPEQSYRKYPNYCFIGYGRRWRLNCHNVLDVSCPIEYFDRWALSRQNSIPMAAKTEKEFVELVKKLYNKVTNPSRGRIALVRKFANILDLDLGISDSIIENYRWDYSEEFEIAINYVYKVRHSKTRTSLNAVVISAFNDKGSSELELSKLKGLLDRIQYESARGEEPLLHRNYRHYCPVLWLKDPEYVNYKEAYIKGWNNGSKII